MQIDKKTLESWISIKISSHLTYIIDMLSTCLKVKFAKYDIDIASWCNIGYVIMATASKGKSSLIAGLFSGTPRVQVFATDRYSLPKK